MVIESEVWLWDEELLTFSNVSCLRWSRITEALASFSALAVVEDRVSTHPNGVSPAALCTLLDVLLKRESQFAFGNGACII
jgi:hypothetical protein